MKPSDLAAQTAKVLIVTALPKEAAAVQTVMDALEPIAVRDDPHLYELGTFNVGQNSRRVITASSGMGTLSASDVTTHALRSFPGIEHIIMVGIAGGCPNPTKPDEHVRLGDIVVTSSTGGILQYDNIKVTQKGVEYRSSTQRPSAAIARADAALATGEYKGERPWEAHISKGIERLGESYARPPNELDRLYAGQDIITHPVDRERRDGHPKVYRGVIAAADTLQKDPTKRDFLRDNYGVRAVEMEASGIQSAAWSVGKDVFIVRGICDYCDEHKGNHWQCYAALVAAGYMRALVERLPTEWFSTES